MPQNETCIFAKSRSKKKKCSHENPIKYHRLREGQLRVAGPLYEMKIFIYEMKIFIYEIRISHVKR